MGFFDSFKSAASKAQAEKARSLDEKDKRYKTVLQEDNARYRELNSKSDSQLMSLARSASGRDESIIHSILSGRGYTRVGGNYRRL